MGTLDGDAGWGRELGWYEVHSDGQHIIIMSLLYLLLYIFMTGWRLGLQVKMCFGAGGASLFVPF